MNILILFLLLLKINLSVFAENTQESFAWNVGVENRKIYWCLAGNHTKEETDKIYRLARHAEYEWSANSWDRSIYDYQPPTIKSKEKNEPYVQYLQDKHGPHGWNDFQACDGTEEVTIYFGDEDERVKKVKSFYENPLAFSHLEEYDEETGKGRGFIWIAKSPETLAHENNLLALILHEFGHVRGHDHIAGTVMDENLANQISKQHAAGSYYQPGSGSWNSMISSKRRFGIFINDLFSINHYQKVEATETKETLKIILEKTLFGTTHISYQGSSLYVHNGTCFRWNQGLEQTSCKPMELKLEYKSTLEFTSGAKKLSKMRYQGKTYFTPLRYYIHTGLIINTKTGKQFEFMRTQNLHDYDEIYLISSGKKYLLMRSE